MAEDRARPVVTFITDNDSAANPYFTAATRYWRRHGYAVFVSTALAPEIIGLKQETELTWRAGYFDVDLGTIDILPINDAFCSDTVIRTVNPMQAARGLRELSNVSA